MASKRRLRRNACTGKLCHPSEDAAKAHVIRLRKLHAQAQWWRIHAYRCPFGSHWHVGHS